jgi:hypothetical protein
MAKKKRRSWLRRAKRGRRSPRTIRILPILGLANYGVQIATAGGKIEKLKSGDFGGYAQWAMKDAIKYGTGFDIIDHQWRGEDFMYGTGTILIMGVVSKVMDWLGVNKKFKGLPRPLNRVAL